MGCLYSQQNSHQPQVRSVRSNYLDAPVIPESSQEDPAQFVEKASEKQNIDVSRAIEDGQICPYCRQSSPDYYLCCGHCYHRGCAKENYKCKECCCACRYDYLDDVAPILFEEDQFPIGKNAPFAVEEVCQVNECPICFEEIRKEDLKILPCNHRMHQICFEQLMEYQNRCPMCRKCMVRSK